MNTRSLATKMLVVTRSRSSSAFATGCTLGRVMGNTEQPVSASRRFSSSIGATPSFFETFGVPTSFKIDLGDLKVKYRAKMMEIHPDKLQQSNATGSQATSENGGSNKTSAAEVTHAYHQLRHPHSRAVHLLELATKSSTESLPDQDNVVLDPPFLLQIMELREQVDEAAASRDKSSLAQLEQENQQRVNETVQNLEQAFAQDDWDAATTLTAELQYWIRLQEAIQEHYEKD